MVWFIGSRGRRVRAGYAFAAVVAGASLASAPSVRAADLDYDAPRYDSSRDYYGDRERDWRPARAERYCAERGFVHEDLRAQGWRDFRNVEPRGNVALVEARRVGSGRLFLLTVDRCNGDVVSAEPMAAPRRDYLRRFDDNDWRWRNDRNWDRRADWRDDRAPWRRDYGPRYYRNSY